MTTTIDNNQRIFILFGTGWNTQKYVCNMSDIVNCAKQFDKNQPYQIHHIWDYKLHKLTVKYVIELLEANQLDSSYFKKAKQLKTA